MTPTRRNLILGAAATALLPAALRAATPQEVAAALNSEGAQLLVYWPAGSNFRRWITDTVVAGFERHVKESYGVDLQIGQLSTGGGDAAFWQRVEAHHLAGARRPFPIDVVRVAPDARTLRAIRQGWLSALPTEPGGPMPHVASLNAAGRATFTHQGRLFAAPLYQPTISFFYDSARLPTPPSNLDALLTWAAAHPGRFTYEDPRSSSGIGSGTMFLLAVMHRFGDETDPATWERGWDYLRALQPHVHPQPNTGEQALELMRRGAIDLMAFWNDWGLFARESLRMPTMRNYLIDSGLPVRNTPLAIPAGAAHPLAAQMFVNYAVSPVIQRSLATIQRQIPASVAPEVWAGIPEDAFGFPYETIRAKTFPSFHTEGAIAAIAQLANRWGREVLGR
jgi:putative thiamine transport system substrate-binding protein